MPWPIRPDRITLRACLDLDWRVLVSCPRCRYMTQLHLERVAIGRVASRPIAKLLEGGAFRCHRRCDGAPADRVSVSAMDVGVSKDIASWSTYDVGGRRSVRLEDS